MTFKQYVDNGIRFHNYKLVLLDLKSSTSDWDVNIIEVHAPDIRTAIFQGYIQYLSRFRSDVQDVSSTSYRWAKHQSISAQVTLTRGFAFIDNTSSGDVVFILRDDNKHYAHLNLTMQHPHIKEYLRDTVSAEHILNEFDIIHEMNKLSSGDDAMFDGDFLDGLL